jgi:hypothetical protein
MKVLWLMLFVGLFAVVAWTATQYLGVAPATSGPQISQEDRAALEAQMQARAEEGRQRLLAQQQEFAAKLTEWNSELPLDGTDLSGSGAVVIRVEDPWHTLPYEERLAFAQEMQKIWAEIYSPEVPADAYISIVDAEGNPVGGSDRVVASQLWVQKPKDGESSSPQQ